MWLVLLLQSRVVPVLPSCWCADGGDDWMWWRWRNNCKRVLLWHICGQNKQYCLQWSYRIIPVCVAGRECMLFCTISLQIQLHTHYPNKGNGQQDNIWGIQTIFWGTHLKRIQTKTQHNGQPGHQTQLIVPHNHRVNAAERAIQTFKDVFIAALATTDVNFPLQLWDELKLQVQTCLNLMRRSRIDPSKLVYETF